MKPRDEELFLTGAGRGREVAALVVGAAEDRNDLQDHVPVLGHAQLAAAAEAEDVDRRAVPGHLRLSEVDLEAAADRVRLTSLEVRRDEPALAAAEDRPFVQRSAGIRRRVPGPRAPTLPEDDAQADEHQDERKEVAQVEAKEAERAQEKERAQRDENRPGEKRAVRELREADRDEDERPELPELADVHEAEVVEREEDSARDEREADDEPGQGVVTRAGVFDRFFRPWRVSR